MATWDIAQGLQIPGQAEAADANGSDPLAAIRSINALATTDGTAILVLVNFHRFLQSAEIVQALARSVDRHGLFPLLMAPRAWPPFKRRLDRYGRFLAPLYRAIHEVEGSRIVIDSSNWNCR